MRLGHASEKSLQALAKQGLLKGANTCKMKFFEYYVLSKKINVKFDIAFHRIREIIDYMHTDG